VTGHACLWGRLATCGGLETRLAGRSPRLRGGRLTIGRRIPSCPTTFSERHSILRVSLGYEPKTPIHMAKGTKIESIAAGYWLRVSCRCHLAVVLRSVPLVSQYPRLPAHTLNRG
jgi:hypothetical protein